MNDSDQPTITGWREWISLPDIGVPNIQAKIDTGSETSILHTPFIEHYRRDNELWVRFCLNPFGDEECSRVVCQAPVKTTKTIQASENHNEPFFVIETLIKIGGLQTHQDIVLKNQKDKEYMMHLGRNVLQALNIQVDPNCSYELGDYSEEDYRKTRLYA